MSHDKTKQDPGRLLNHQLMKPSSAKAKGRRLQQEVAESILRAFPDLRPDDVRSTSMGAGGEDVQLSTQARALLPLSIEAKNQERVAVWAALEQASKNAPAGSTPCLVIRKNRQVAHAVVPWEYLLSLLASKGRGGGVGGDSAEQEREEERDVASLLCSLRKTVDELERRL